MTKPRLDEAGEAVTPSSVFTHRPRRAVGLQALSENDDRAYLVSARIRVYGGPLDP